MHDARMGYLEYETIGAVIPGSYHGRGEIGISLNDRPSSSPTVAKETDTAQRDPYTWQRLLSHLT